jgi:electron-transferring-flavoprotein dehydrogenase
MLAAEAAFAALNAGANQGDDLASYADAYRRSWVYRDLHRVRNVKPGLSKWGTWLGTLHGGAQMWLHNLGLGFLVPWTLHHQHPDNETLMPANHSKKIVYPKPDGKITFDKLSSVFISNTNHEEDQPVHLVLGDQNVPIAVNLPRYAAPEQRYCPAGVYEIVETSDGAPRLQINAQNCVHCKTCDIKDPTQNINWVVPEGGGGPNYPNM